MQRSDAEHSEFTVGICALGEVPETAAPSSLANAPATEFWLPAGERPACPAGMPTPTASPPAARDATEPLCRAGSFLRICGFLTSARGESTGNGLGIVRLGLEDALRSLHLI
jgi:hypothetical protein